MRTWNPATDTALATIPVHHLGRACAQVAGLLVVGLDVGPLAIGLAGPP